MLLLAKLAGILVLIWFYLTGKKVEDQGIKWAVIGIVGYWITWWLADFLILDSLTGSVTKGAGVFLVTQIPVVFAVVAAFFIRKKLMSSAQSEE